MVQSFQAEVLEELQGGAIEKWPARLVQPADWLDKLSSDQGLQYAVTIDPADRFDVAARQGLAIGNHRQSLERCRRQPGGEVQTQEFLDE